MQCREKINNLLLLSHSEMHSPKSTILETISYSVAEVLAITASVFTITTNASSTLPSKSG